MDALAHFTIPVSGLKNGPHQYVFRIDNGFFQSFPESPIHDGKVDVRFTFDKQPDMYAMTFELAGTVKTACDRCLETFNLPIEDTQALLVKFDEKEWEDADIIYIPKDTQKLNVARYIYEFIVLAVPLTKTHENAELECDPNMLKYIQDENQAEPASNNPIWDALKGFHSEN